MKKIVMIGYMGSGKSTVGKALSKVLSVPFVDLDHKIEEAEGMSIPELFTSKGEIYFRRKERTVLFSLLKTNKPAIIATGGGTPCYGDTMKTLINDPNTIVIYLMVSLDELVSRLDLEKSNRPLIAHLETQSELKDFVRKHVFERSYYYNQAHLIIPADDSEGNVTEAIVGNLF